MQKTKFSRTALLLCSCAFLASCASYVQHRKDAKMLALDASVITSGDAIILVSTSADQKCVLSPKSFIIISKIGPAQSKFDGGLLSVNNWSSNSDFVDRLGHVYGLRLEPGEYKAYVTVAGGWTLNGALEARFSVAAGEARYLGDIEAHGCNPITLYTVDRWMELKPEFQSRLVNFDVEKVSITPIQFELKEK